MSLATRCTACGTVFRVVQDQLKISEGWVRCGRCKEVFNALEGLFDLDREAPPPWNPPAPAPGPAATVDVDLPVDETIDAASAPTAAVSASAASVVDEDATSATASTAASDSEPTSDSAPPMVHADVEPEAAPVAAVPLVAPPDTDHVVDDAVSRFGPQHEPLDGASAAGAAADEAGLHGAAEPEPGAPAFLRDAERRARWQSPWVRALLGVAAIVLTAALALQAAYQLRDTIAARWPQTRPLLSAMCERLDCAVAPLRRIDDIAVESSSLTRTAEPGADALRLTVVLRNRGELALAIPMVDLSLTDGNGELVARRALAAGDFERAPATLAPASETSLQLAFSTDGRRVAGYTVEIFYP